MPELLQPHPRITRICVCEHYVEEVRRCLVELGRHEVEVEAFPARCGHPPLAETDLDASQEHTLVLGSSCLGRLQPTPQKRLQRMQNCHELLVAPSLLEGFLATGAYMVTSGWLKRWRENVANWGGDNNVARDLLREGASRLMWLDTGIFDLDAEMEVFATTMGLPWDRMPVSLAHMKRILVEHIDGVQPPRPSAQDGSLNEARRQAADRALALDFLSQLSQDLLEQDVLARIISFFTVLFDASHVRFHAGVDAALPPHEDYAESPEGFCVRMGRGDRSVGTLHISGFSFPEYRSHYLNLTMSMADVCALAVLNARAYQSLRDAQASQRVMLDVLDAFYHPGSLTQELEQVLEHIQAFTAADGVSLRLTEGTVDYCARGFPMSFIQQERDLTLKDVEGNARCDAQGKPLRPCLCGSLLNETLPGDVLHRTPWGSFWTNNLATFFGMAPSHMFPDGWRKRCLEEGYRTMALIPIRSEKKVVGLLQVNHKTPDRMDLPMVELLEGLTGSIALGLERQWAEERLRRMNQELEARVLFRTQELATINETLKAEIMQRRLAESRLADQTLQLRTRLKELSCLYAISSLVERHEGSLETLLESVVVKLPMTWPSGARIHTRIQAMDLLRQSQDFRTTPWRKAVELLHGSEKCGLLEIYFEVPPEMDPLDFESGRLLEGLADLLQSAMKRAEMAREKKKIEEQLFQAQKLDAVGTLAGGIAHDFNNILTPILGFAELGMSMTAEGHALRHTFEMIMKGGQRAKELVNQILVFSRKGELNVAPVLLAPILKEGLKLIRASLPSTIDIQARIVSEDVFVLADPTQIHQILLNLCTNAFHAMEDKGGTLEITLGRTTMGEGDLVTSMELKPGSYAVMQVSDTGCGMPKDVVARIFEPFFTTKGIGKGTGLGLSVVHGLVKSYHGHISVYSEPGQGSRFQIYLPEHARGEAPKDLPPSPIPLPVGNERVLIVDDDDGALQTLESLLRDLGYAVTSARHGVQALEMLQRHPAGFDLMITDVTLPQMTGMDLAAAARMVVPSLPVILCSGYSQGLVPGSQRASDAQAFVQKPYAISHMAQVVRQVLDEHGP